MMEVGIRLTHQATMGSTSRPPSRGGFSIGAKMRRPMMVDVVALQAAVRDATLPASLAFPIFDAAGLREAEQPPSRSAL